MKLSFICSLKKKVKVVKFKLISNRNAMVHVQERIKKTLILKRFQEKLSLIVTNLKNFILAELF